MKNTGQASAQNQQQLSNMLGNSQYQQLMKNNSGQLYVQQQNNAASSSQAAGGTTALDGQAAMSSAGKISVGPMAAGQVQGQTPNNPMLINAKLQQLQKTGQQQVGNIKTYPNLLQSTKNSFQNPQMGQLQGQNQSQNLQLNLGQSAQGSQGQRQLQFQLQQQQTGQQPQQVVAQQQKATGSMQAQQVHMPKAQSNSGQASLPFNSQPHQLPDNNDRLRCLLQMQNNNQQ